MIWWNRFKGLFSGKGSIIGAGANGIPVEKTAGANGRAIIYDSTAASGLNDVALTTGTVTSAEISGPSIISWSGTPITTSGTFTGTLANQSANQVLAGPTSGGAATPTFRALVAADIAGLSSGLSKFVPGGRLTLTSATPVTTSDVTSATTIYYALYNNDQVPIYDGSSWTATTFTELSQATTDNTKSPAACAANSNYDLFVWSDSSTMRCTRGPAWTSDTGRGTGAGTTELERINGILMNKVAITNGPGANRGTYVGTVRTDGSSQCNDSTSRRCVFNQYNRVVRNLNCVDSTASWTYTTDSFREANGSSTVGTSRVEIVRGQNEEVVLAQNYNVTYNGTSTSTVCGGVGISSTTVNSAQNFGSFISNDGDGQHAATYTGNPGLGYYYIARLERSVAVGTTTWNGTSATARMTLGMMVETVQ